MLADVPLEPHRHARGLTEAATRALAEGRTAEAFRLIDRRCRVPPHPDAAEYLLRAACLARMGEVEGSRADVRTAYAIDPDNALAASWLMDAAALEDRLLGARSLLRIGADRDRLADVVACLGDGRPAVAAFRKGREGVEGWVAWRDPGPVRLLIGFDDAPEQILSVPGDRTHPLAHCLGSAAEVSFAWPDDVDTVGISVDRPCALVEGGFLARPRSFPLQPRDPHATPGPPRLVTVVIPVFDDHEATARCLRTLLDDAPVTVERRIVVVDDRSPNPRITDLVDVYARSGAVTLIRNRANLGFARSVNRALAAAEPGDVLLLNADTAVPPGFLDRLARAAYAAPDIGTVTPLSNNGENTSLPDRFVENPLPDDAEIRRLDACAAAANPGLVVDMPNGTGFCLYVRADCLRSVGPLGTQYGRGYLEDVDLCLRASQAGFRNVCAADVYVGHAGTRSFGAEKQALVARNLAQIETAYPGYDRRCASFFASDPLRDAIAAVEASQIATGQPIHLAFAVAEADPALVAARVEKLRGRHSRLIVARIASRGDRLAVTLRDPAGDIPQSLSLSVSGPAGLARALRRVPLCGSTLLTDEPLPAAISAALSGLGAIERFTLLPDLSPPAARMDAALGRTRWVDSVLAILAPPADEAGFAFLTQLARLWTGRRHGPALVVVGRTLDDLRLMATGRVFVTGSYAQDDLPQLLRRYSASALAAPAAFAPDHPDRLFALRSTLPIALPGPHGLGPRDLALPTVWRNVAETVQSVAVWCGQSVGNHDAHEVSNVTSGRQGLVSAAS